MGWKRGKEADYLLLCFLDQELQLLSVDSEGFLAEHVLARFEAEHGVLVVVRVRRGDVDDVDVGIGHEFAVGAIGFCRRGSIDLLDKFLRALLARGAADCDDGVLHVCDTAALGVDEEVPREGLGDGACGEDSPANCLRSHDGLNVYNMGYSIEVMVGSTNRLLHSKISIYLAKLAPPFPS